MGRLDARKHYKFIVRSEAEIIVVGDSKGYAKVALERHPELYIKELIKNVTVSTGKVITKIEENGDK